MIYACLWICLLVFCGRTVMGNLLLYCATMGSVHISNENHKQKSCNENNESNAVPVYDYDFPPPESFVVVLYVPAKVSKS